MPNQTLTTLARAKINLTLHVGAAQNDGHHQLHSLVVFADIGDDLSLQMSSIEAGPRLYISGPFADNLPSSADNLILHAYENYSNRGDAQPLFYLVKNLPIASGIGGGSADAAAVLRLLRQNNPEEAIDNGNTFLSIGADVPVCILSKTCLMEGIGEKLTPLPGLGQVAAILVNPGVAVSTGAIFQAFDKSGTSSEFALPSGTLLEMAQAGRNDLQDIAIGIEPVIQTVLDEIGGQKNCQLVRMSGSGATCFGLFKTFEQARNASATIKNKYPDWWCAPTMLGDMP